MQHLDHSQTMRMSEYAEALGSLLERLEISECQLCRHCFAPSYSIISEYFDMSMNTFSGKNDRVFQWSFVVGHVAYG
jgi:hypothetical protein